MRLFQCYTTSLNDWREISLLDFLKKFPDKRPKYEKKFFWLNEKTFEIYELYTTDVFYDHLNDKFVYISEIGKFEENSIYDSYESALNYLKSFEGNVKLLIPIPESNNYIEKFLYKM